MQFSLLTAVTAALALSQNAAGMVLSPRQAQTLHAAMVSKGKEYFGTSLTVRNDNNEQSITRGEFGSVTPENAQKWDQTEPNRGQFNWGGADQHMNWAQQNGKQVRCHTLVWHSQLPGWVSNSGFNNQTLIQVMNNHITQVMNRYRGRCTHWDVVNEALEEDGSFRNSVFYRVIGPAYIPLAFKHAASVDPTAKLYYNDYNLEYGEAKALGAKRIVELVQSYGVRIDGVGLQGHLVVESTPTQSTPTPSKDHLEKVLRMYTDLNVDVAYTEIDIRMNQPFSQQKLQLQAQQYANVTLSCMAVKRCVGLTVWGVSDRYSWVPQTFPGEGAPLLWSDNFQKKPAYQATLNAILNAPPAT